MRVSINLGPAFGGPCIGDPLIVGPCSVPLIFVNSHIVGCDPAQLGSVSDAHWDAKVIQKPKLGC